MTLTELFLDRYKQLETELEKRYQREKRRFSSVVNEFIRDSESEPIREHLQTCREIRNLLTHNANVGGLPVAQPSKPIVAMMGEILNYVKTPPLAISVATKGENILKANMSQRVLRLMEVMVKNGYSHVPVMENGIFCGVFSQGAVFMYTLYSKKQIRKDTTIAEMKAHLPIEQHHENYVFVNKRATQMEIRRIFERIREKNRRVSVVFITETGKIDEPLLGMVTPWDIIKITQKDELLNLYINRDL